MKLHTILPERAVVNHPALLWVDTPVASIQRRLLERDGEEVACAAEGTSAATHEKPVSCGITACAQGATLDLSVVPHEQGATQGSGQ